MDTMGNILDIAIPSPFAEDDSNKYYLVDGKIVALAKADDAVVWTNSDAGDVGTVYAAVDEDGKLYLSFSSGIFFMAIDGEGNTICKMDILSSEYGCPYGLEIADEKIKIGVDKSPKDCEPAIWLNKEDYSHIHNWIPQGWKERWICSICGEPQLFPDENSADCVIGDVGENLYYYVIGNTLFAVRKEDGSEAWKKEYNKYLDGIMYALDENNILYLTSGIFLAIDTSGKTLCSINLSAAGYLEPSAIEIIDHQAVITMDVYPEGYQNKIYINTDDFSHEHIWTSGRPACCFVCGITQNASGYSSRTEAYRSALLGLETIYGKGEACGVPRRYFNGVCYAELLDLDHDGAEELLAIGGNLMEGEYYYYYNYKIYIYSYQNGKLTVTEFTETPELNGLLNSDGGCKYFELDERDGKYYFVTNCGGDDLSIDCYYELTKDKKLSLYQVIPPWFNELDVPEEMRAKLVTGDAGKREMEQYHKYRMIHLNDLYGDDAHLTMDYLNQTRSRLGLEQIPFEIGPSYWDDGE